MKQFFLFLLFSSAISSLEGQHSNSSLNGNFSTFIAKVDARKTFLGTPSESRAYGYGAAINGTIGLDRANVIVGLGYKVINTTVDMRTSRGGFASSFFWSVLTGRYVDTYEEVPHVVRSIDINTSYLYIPLGARFNTDTNKDAIAYIEPKMVINMPIGTKSSYDDPQHQRTVTKSTSYAAFAITTGMEIRTNKIRLSPQLNIPIFTGSSKLVIGSVKERIGVGLEIGFLL